MKKISMATLTAIGATCFAMTARAPAAEAHPSTIEIPASIEDFDFTLTMKEDSVNPYRISWYEPKPTTMKFNREGQISALNVFSERYKIHHDVKRTDDTPRDFNFHPRRLFAGDEAPNNAFEQERRDDIEDGEHRGLTSSAYSSLTGYPYCHKCLYIALDLAYIGLPSVCDLKDERHVLSYDAMEIVEYVCDYVEHALLGDAAKALEDEHYHHFIFFCGEVCPSEIFEPIP